MGGGGGEGDAEAPSAPDATLQGYLDRHSRPPAFEGSDGNPYTVSVEVEKTPDLSNPYACYLVFPRWAQNGMGIVGHLETHTLWRSRSRQEVEALAGELTLMEVRDLLEQAIQRRDRGRVGDVPDLEQLEP